MLDELHEVLRDWFGQSSALEFRVNTDVNYLEETISVS